MIRIEGWKEFNPKGVLKTPFYFRVSTEIGACEALFGLPITTKWVWICFLAEAMKKKSETFPLNIAWACQQWSIKKNELIEAIESLGEKGLLRQDSDKTRSPLGVGSDKTLPHRIGEDSIGEYRRVEGAEVGTAVLLSAPFESITNELFNTWLKTYEDEAWVRLEIGKAASWIVANPKRAPKKDFGRFLNNWLSRGWESHRKTIPSNQISGIDAWAQKHKGSA